MSLCSGWLCSPAVGASLDNSTRPNIIYILADDLGYGDLGSYGQRRIRTPSLDRMASEGMRFTSHYAGSTVCGPSRASLLTGLHTGHSPIRGNPKWTASGQPVDLSAGDITLAKVLQQAGYHTAAIGKWGLAERREPRENAVNPAMPLQQGFDYFFGYKHHLDAHYYYWPTLYRNNHPYVLRENDHLTNKGIYTHDLFTEQALAV
ncbi:MAG: sulfatase-like hydrolase/transferase, partial [Porticoccaceae bacterium]|nr:sulfatase-like hydrolase/transferase [Porticoccaceae bacterium]